MKSVNRVHIIAIETDSELSESLFSLFLSEWPDMGDFESSRFGLQIPNPIVALKDDMLIGGASFTSYKAPDAREMAVWLNALYVRPEYRNQGIASSLVAASQSVAEVLYALTDVPELYTKAAWKKLSNDQNGSIVKFSKNT